jgi:Na+/H+ antiporter NhaD/arsenite permease-like protein
MITTLGRFAREQIFELCAAVAAAAFLLSGRLTLDRAARSIDYDLLFVLFALLVTVEILRHSGYLDRAVAMTVARFNHTRSFAVMAIVTTAVLSCLITNDVALFVVIPFTVIASRMSDFDIEDEVVLEVIAANLIGCLTPLGNPQNLFVYHRSDMSAGQFVSTMWPFVAWSAVGLLIAVFLLGREKKIEIAQVQLPPRNVPAAIAGALAFLLVILEIARVAPGWMAALGAALAGAAFLGRRMFQIDFSIIPLFFFAFIVVEGMRTFDLGALMRMNLYVTGIAISQFISNVPATVLLTPFAGSEWRELLYSVNAGGCGTIIASLANLLGWRIYVRESNRDKRFFWRLTAINFVFLAWAGFGGWFLLRL